MDRASRFTKYLIELAGDLKGRGVELLSLKEKTDTSTAMGKFFFRMTVSIADLERNIVLDRTLAGLAVARARGRKGDRKKSITEGQKLEAKRLAETGELEYHRYLFKGWYQSCWLLSVSCLKPQTVRQGVAAESLY